MGIKTNLKQNGILLYIGRVHEGCFWEPWNSERHKEDSNLQVVSDRMVSNHLQFLYGIVAYDWVNRHSITCRSPAKPVLITSDYNQQRYSDGTDFRIG